MRNFMTTHLDDYAAKYKEFVKFKRDKNILQIQFHHDGGPWKWGLEVHRAIPYLMFDIKNDPDNECLIMTGTGDSFLADFDTESFERGGFMKGAKRPAILEFFYQDQTRQPMAILDLEIPVIAAVNGPSIVHAEIPLLSDIVICAENTFFSESHWQTLGLPPSDGVQTLFREILGPIRAKHFLLMGTKIYADEALALGLVGEVLPAEKLLDRAWEIAEKIFMSKFRVQRRMTRALLATPWRELFHHELPLGLANESFCATNYSLFNLTDDDQSLKDQRPWTSIQKL